MSRSRSDKPLSIASGLEPVAFVLLLAALTLEHVGGDSPLGIALWLPMHSGLLSIWGLSRAVRLRLNSPHFAASFAWFALSAPVLGHALVGDALHLTETTHPLLRWTLAMLATGLVLDTNPRHRSARISLLLATGVGVLGAIRLEISLHDLPWTLAGVASLHFSFVHFLRLVRRDQQPNGPSFGEGIGVFGALLAISQPQVLDDNTRAQPGTALPKGQWTAVDSQFLQFRNRDANDSPLLFWADGNPRIVTQGELILQGDLVFECIQSHKASDQILDHLNTHYRLLPFPTSAQIARSQPWQCCNPGNAVPLGALSPNGGALRRWLSVWDDLRIVPLAIPSPANATAMEQDFVVVDVRIVRGIHLIWLGAVIHAICAAWALSMQKQTNTNG